MTTIRDVVTQRGIKNLLHFTRAANLPTILQHGLHPRRSLTALGVAITYNDQYRLDQTDAICVSISFPNYKMFWGCRKDHSEVEWAVIGIDPCILWELDCVFCAENAASNHVTCLSVEDRRGLQAFSRLFEDAREKKRSDLNIPDKFPTNPQAEVLVLEPILPNRIFGVAFEDRNLKEKYTTQFPGVRMEAFPALFKYRNDWEHWK